MSHPLLTKVLVDVDWPESPQALKVAGQVCYVVSRPLRCKRHDKHDAYFVRSVENMEKLRTMKDPKPFWGAQKVCGDFMRVRP